MAIRYLDTILFRGGQPDKRNPEASFTTPRKFAVSITPSNGENEVDNPFEVQVSADKAEFSTKIIKRYTPWEGSEKPPEQPRRRLWTRDYIGTDQKFYDAGYRWGVSLGASPEAFQKSALYLRGGGVNLPDGKYLIVFKADKNGLTDVVIGAQERGVDSVLLTDFKKGKKLKTNRKKEILLVSNHSMLASRGQPLNAGNADEFSIIFAGEMLVQNKRSRMINDQSGQFYGPDGLIKPFMDFEGKPSAEDALMKHPDYEVIKREAMEFADHFLERLTGQTDIHKVSVEFVPKRLTPEKEAELRQPRRITLSAEQAERLRTLLAQPSVRSLLDAQDHAPEKQIRLLQALANRGEYYPAVSMLLKQLVAEGTLKPEQGDDLVVYLLEEPDGMDLFLQESSLYLPSVSNNTKGKLLAGFRDLGLHKSQKLSDFIRELQRHSDLLGLITGQRIASSFFAYTLPFMKAAGNAAAIVRPLMGLPNLGKMIEMQPVMDSSPILIVHLGAATSLIRLTHDELEKSPSPKDVVLLNNPFDGKGSHLEHVRENVGQLRQLADKGARVLRFPDTSPSDQLDYLHHLYAWTEPNRFPRKVLRQKRMERLFKAYGIDAAEVYGFARKNYRKRWANELILTVLAQKNEAFRQLLDDLRWFASLPTTEIPRQ